MPLNTSEDEIESSSAPSDDISVTDNEPDYDHSRGFHLYLITENAELLNGCNRVLQACYPPQEINTRKRLGAARKAIRRIVIALYKEWEDDPTKFVTISLNNNDWSPNGRYGKLQLSITHLKKAINYLSQHELIHFHLGDETAIREDRKQTRIRAEPRLIETMHLTESQGDTIQTRVQSDKYRFLSMGIRPRTILKDDQKQPVKIERTPSEIKRGEELLERYQAVLNQTEIFNPETGRLVQSYDMFQYRIFNRNSFDFNGRVFGGFWQRCKKDYRRQITLDDQPTVEIDYRGTFPVMVYHFLGIDYWRQHVNLPESELYKADPYYLPGYTDQPLYGKDFRKALKHIFLTAINIENKACNVRSVSMGLKKKMEDEWLKDQTRDHRPAVETINAVRAKLIKKFLFELHAPVSEYFFDPDIGLSAMKAESQVAMRIIDKFTGLGKPILTIYDSFVVKREDSNLLAETMVNCYYQTTGFTPFMKHE